MGSDVAPSRRADFKRIWAFLAISTFWAIESFFKHDHFGLWMSVASALVAIVLYIRVRCSSD